MPSSVRLLLFALIALPGLVMAETPVPVEVMTVQRANIAEEVALHGSLVAQRVSRVSSQIDGLVTLITVDDGDVVERGAELVRLDPRLAAITRDAENARLAEARARLAEARRRHGELARLKATRNVAETSVAAAAAQIGIDTALVQQAEAALERSREILARHTVRAPFNAVVRKKLVELGEWVETSTALLELVDIDVLRLEVPVPQFYFSAIDTRTGVRVRLDALPDEVLAATVTRKIPVSDAASRTFLVRIDLPNQQGRLAPGMSARVLFSIAVPEAQAVLMVPRDAVVRAADGTVRVWTIETRDGVSKAVPRLVKLGRAYQQHLEVVSGQLDEGDELIVRGNEILRDGQSVRVTRAADPDHAP